MTSQNKPSDASSAPARKSVLFLSLIAAGIGFSAAVAYHYIPHRLDTLKAELQGRTAIVDPPSLTGNYLAGRYAATQGDYANADHFLKQTLKYDPENSEIAGYTYRMNLVNGNMEAAVAMAQRLYDAGEEGANPEIMIFLSRVKTGNYQGARDVLKEFEVHGFNLVVVPLLEKWLDQAEGKIKQPVQQQESLRRIVEFAPFIHYQTAILNDLAGFDDEALVQYNESLALSKTVPYRVVEMVANLHARRGEWDKADALYDKYNEQNPDSERRSALPDENNRKSPPARLIKDVQQGIAEILFSTASILHNENLNEEALIYIQQVLYLNPDFPAAKLMRGTILEDSDRFAEALAAYDALPESSPYYQRAQIRKAYVLSELDQSDAALAVLGRLLREKGKHYHVQLARGDIQMRLKQYPEAVASYSKALEEERSGQEGLWAVHYARGISYERSEKWTEAEQDFRKALELQPNQPDVMNYLAYSWLTREERIEEATVMLKKAVAARPGDAHIIDSMGWAFYMAGEYDAALKHLEKAIELMPIDPTVNDHLGDTFWRLGRRNEARFQWKRALLFNPEPEQEAELNRKLEEGLAEREPQALAVETESNQPSDNLQ